VKRHFIFKQFIIFALAGNLGCYSNWQDLNSILDKISCDTTKDKVFELARINLIEHDWDETHQLLSMYKNSDALAVTFDKNDNLISVSISKSQIKLLGLFRKQGEPILHLDCQKRYLK